MNRLKRWFFTSMIITGAMLAVYFFARNFLLHQAIDQLSKRLMKDRRMELTIAEAHCTGFSAVVMNNITIVPEKQDTLLSADSVYVKVSLFSLLRGKIRLKEAEISNARISLVCKNGTCNFDQLKARKSTGESAHSEVNYGRFISRLVDRIYNYTPQRAAFKNLHVSYQQDKHVEQLNITSFLSSKDKMTGTFVNPADHNSWSLSGEFSQRRHTFDFKVYPDHKMHFTVPFIQSLYEAECRFDTLHCVLREHDLTGSRVKFSGTVSATDFMIRHRKISDKPVVVHQADFNIVAYIGKKYVELDSSSTISVNNLLMRPYFIFSNDIGKKYGLKITMDKLPANHLFHSFPEGMFEQVEGVEADGNLEYKLNFFLNASQPDSLFFSSSLKKENFRLKRYGRGNLQKMNGEFLYSAYNGERFVRSFAIGPSNPDFTPLENISSHFKNAVLTSEDGSFFFHNGFNEDAFKKSIGANYKSGKFVRGGSTITMQLVKNVFLTRHKTVARKLEEALIVWLIESNHLCSKARMFEVYLNIIELGPDVYGIKEASRFYFDKKPSELSLAESVFLASLLPRPKWFKYSFDEQGNLKPYFADYYRVVANFLLKKNLITQFEYDQLQPQIIIKGPAKNFITPQDSFPSTDDEGINE